jgi:HAD superfamily hydrolase (TIGR01549 family)
LHIETLSLDAGGVLTFPNWERISDTFARHGIRVTADALQESDPHARFAVDQAHDIAAIKDADRGSRYFRLMFERAGVPADTPIQPVLDELWRYHTEHNLWEYVPAEVVPALERLRATGVRLAIGSNANGALHRLFDRLGLTCHFDAICDSYVEGVEKPDPRFFHIVVQRAGGRPETTLHVGDLYHVDVVGARSAGLQAMLFDPHDLYAAFDTPRIHTLDQIVTLVTRP